MPISSYTSSIVGEELGERVGDRKGTREVFEGKPLKLLFVCVVFVCAIHAHAHDDK